MTVDVLVKIVPGNPIPQILRRVQHGGQILCSGEVRRFGHINVVEALHMRLVEKDFILVGQQSIVLLGHQSAVSN